MTNRMTVLPIKYGSDSHGIKKGDVLYYARIMPNIGYYEILELKIRTLEETYFVGTDKHTKQAFLFGYDSLNKSVFQIRQDALEKVKEAEKYKKDISNEKYYEEY